MKKEDELYYVSEFLKLRPDLEITGLIPDEEPDFICDHDGHRLGIELSRFFYPTNASVPPQAVHAYREATRKQLVDEHMKRRLPPVHVWVHMYEDRSLFKAESRQSLTAKLIEFAADHIPASDAHVNFGYDDLPRGLSDFGVDSLNILRGHSLTQILWSFPTASCLPESHAGLVQDVIQKKEKKLEAYRRKAPQNWLLLLSGTDGLHSLIYNDGNILSSPYRFNFERVFLFRMSGQVYELRKN